MFLILLFCIISNIHGQNERNNNDHHPRIPFLKLHDKGEPIKDFNNEARKNQIERLHTFQLDKRRAAMKRAKERRALVLEGKLHHSQLNAPPIVRSQRIENQIESSTPSMQQQSNKNKLYDLGFHTSFEQRQQRDAALIEAGQVLPVNCSTLNELNILQDKYTSGTTVLAYTGTFRDEDVVIKKPRTITPGGLTIAFETALDRFQQEAYMLLHYRHANHVRYLGGCFEKGKITNVVQKLRPWHGQVKRKDFAWQQRLCAAIRLAQLVKFWKRGSNGARVHCDFFTHQFAFDRKFNPYMIDIDGLLPVGVGNSSVCQPDNQNDVNNELAPSKDCRTKCWKAELWPPRFNVNDDSLDELQCQTSSGTCVGFNYQYNTFSFGKTLLQDLFLPQNIDREATPSGLLDAIRLVVDGATRPSNFHRWSIDRVCTKLEEILLTYAPGHKCPAPQTNRKHTENIE